MKTPETTPHASITPQTHAVILSEALPFMQRYDEQVVVVKYGGHAMGDETLARCFASDIVLLEQAGVKPVVVHGGGPQIGKLLDRLADQERIRRWLARHRRRHRRSGRDGAGRVDQQADRGGDQQGGRARLRHLRQGRQSADRQEAGAAGARPQFQHREGDRPGLRRRAGGSQPAHRRGDRGGRAHPGDRADRGVARGRHLQHQRRHLRQRPRQRNEGDAVAAADRCRRACWTGTAR